MGDLTRSEICWVNAIVRHFRKNSGVFLKSMKHASRRPAHSASISLGEVQAKYQFASDNTAGICPEAWTAMGKANEGFEASYGMDRHTEKASDLFRTYFETQCEVFFVFNGTAANSLSLASLCQSYHSVIAHDTSHVETDECGAPEFFSNGTKLLLGTGAGGKLAPAAVEALITKRQDIHYPRPRVLSLSQPTELGTRYQPEELKQLCTVAKKHGMRVHMDGARFLLAVVSSGLSPKELSWKAGVDVLCLGGTKAGIGLSEAVVFFDPELAKEFDYRCKQAGQLASKMRYLTAPWISMLENSTYEKYLRSALGLASFFAERAVKIPGVRLLHPLESNAVFLYLPDSMDLFLQQQGWKYYHFIGGGARFMCSWQTQKEDVQALLGDMTRYAAGLSQKSKSSEK